jgi:hypothetical protein
MNKYERLREVCNTPRQHEVIDALIKHGSYEKAANATGTSKNAIHKHVKNLNKRFSAIGKGDHFIANTHIPDGFSVKGTSTLYKDGEPSIQWVKTDREAEDVSESFKYAIDQMIDRIDGKAAPIEIDINTEDDTITKYPLADAHIGLLTWHKEVGKDFDIGIAHKLYIGGFKRLVESAPPSKRALILDLGDTTHTNDQTNQTPGNKHQLDADGRYGKILDTAIAILTGMIDLALTKHEIVEFRKTKGNHDPEASAGLARIIDAYYRNEPRVIVHKEDCLFWWTTFGKTGHFSTHGDKTNYSQLPEIAAHDMREVWSDIEYLYIDTGHVHHQQIKETRIAIMESHNTLAAGDSYNYGHGYRSQRNLKSISYHKDYGEIQRNTVNIAMIMSKDK